MANNFTERIEELEQDRRRNLREAKRARARRRGYLASGKWEKARQARKVATRANEDAQGNLRDIRKLRSVRKEASRVARLLRHRRSAGKAYDGGQLYWYDGRPVRSQVYQHLVWARKNGWQGRVNSGYRTPEYSRSLCRAMCGRDSCPGMCAGVASNHVRIAIDVSDFYKFGQLMRTCPYQPRLYNRLSRDLVHYSPSGN